MRKITLVVCLLSLSLLLGCQEKQKGASLEKILKQEQKRALEAQIDGAWNGADMRLGSTDEMSPRDLAIAHNPGIEQELYLAAVDKENNPVECRQGPMKIVVDNDGKLLLECYRYGQFKPVAVKDDKVVVEQVW